MASIGEKENRPAGASPTVGELYGQIRREILTGVLPAGSAISQVKLAKQLEVNRTPLREALRMLQREGLVEGEYNRRVRIAALSSGDLEELYAARIVQEAVAIQLSVPRFTDDELIRIRELLDEMEETAHLEQLDDWEGCHREFHGALVAHAGTRISSIVADLSDYCERYRRALLRQRPTPTYEIGAREHAAIVAACEQRDPTEASRLLARHLGRTAISLISISDPLHDPVSVRETLRMVIGDDEPPQPFRSAA